MKIEFLSQVAKLELQRIRIRTVWLAAADYPKLLGCADIGISLHTSSSGLDLPMKVVDMFGCGLPVCAVDFRCLEELVQDGQNGHVFDTPDGLAEKIEKLCTGWDGLERHKTGAGRREEASTGPSPELARIRHRLREFQKQRWVGLLCPGVSSFAVFSGCLGFISFLFFLSARMNDFLQVENWEQVVMPLIQTKTE